MNEESNTNHCAYYITRKKRYCRMRPVLSHKFCPEHSLFDEVLQNNESTARMPCPLDRKHTCFVKGLEEHLKKCNSREKEKPIYYQKSINGRILGKNEEKVTISEISDEELTNLITKVKKTCNEFLMPLEIEEISHPVLNSALKDSKNGQLAIKHLRQQASLLGHMKNMKLLSNETCFVEFGAGRGQLTSWIIQAVNNKNSCKFILIDRASQRHKNNYLLQGIIMALCCHHQCTWQTYVGRTFLEEQKYNQREFQLLCGIASWATCGRMPTHFDSNDDESNMENNNTDKNRYRRMNLDADCREEIGRQCKRLLDYEFKYIILFLLIDSNDDESNMENNNTDKNSYRRMNLDADCREEIGRQCKRLLDYGRMRYLIDHNYDAKLICYVEPAVSLENIALVAINKKL
ncbi:tRNA:m(4)X modification enzyme TRM13 homolog [Centruroides sculpturatus]|uniref:tRNA:m(4)X modification enzyme TRM13 homolog n=1 Tax=Centruroides sculpturatus TaxID=218467 RepID=UPI000C6DC211|nr:tRNA:m(4)X modification enzyme TRM13 homolog [Centruroides sculpturatus]